MTFSYAKYHASILEFAEKVPELLLRHPSTAHLALKISQLGLGAALTSRFTVAIIGQMRSGKSTLLNSLIGQRLGPVGINETTATINWFRHSKGANCATFRVHWLDGSTEDHRLDEIDAWIGRSENAQRTRAIDFFAESDFLASANIVDTPGTRSTIGDHQDTTTGFLAEKLEQETLRHGGRADAVIYVVNPVAKSGDVELLQFFGDKTRLPGASAYNSMAVIQKWEQLRPDPLRKIAEMCDRMRGQLEGKVSEVLPVSGILALTAAETPVPVWQQVAQLGIEAKAEDFEELTLSPQYFSDDIPGAPLTQPARQVLLQQLPWPVLNFALWVARSRQPASGQALKAMLVELSNIDRLKDILQTRFFSLAGLIQAGTALRKAWEPCLVGMLTFRDEIDRRQEQQRLGEQAARILERKNDADFDPIRTYIRLSQQGADKELAHLADAYRQFDEMFYSAEKSFRLLDADMTCLRDLEADTDLTTDEKLELQRLFGQNGPEVHTRLGLSPDMPHNDVLDHASRRHGVWRTREMRAQGRQRKLFAHAVERLETILDHLEGEYDP